MNDIRLFEDIHALAHIYARWCAVFRDTTPFAVYLYGEEPERAERLYKIYLFLEEMYRDE